MAGLKRIPIDQIALGKRIRPIDPVWVAGLADEIRAAGLNSPALPEPIEVRPVKRTGAKYELVVGAHRLEAVKTLGWTEIEARVLHMNAADARLREIDDHIKRKSLTVLAMGRALAEMKRVYLEWYPETRNGAHGGRGGQKNEMDNLSFSNKTATALNLDWRSIDQYISLFGHLAPGIPERIEAARHKLANNQSELSQLGTASPDDQAKILDILLAADATIQTVAEALAFLAGRPVISKTPEYRLLTWWGKADKKTRRNFVEYLIAEGDLAAYGIGPKVLINSAR